MSEGFAIACQASLPVSVLLEQKTSNTGLGTNYRASFADACLDNLVRADTKKDCYF